MSVNIVKRRIQKLGGSSLIVTLPKSWAKKLGLDVGDTIVIVDEGNHLKVFPPDSSLIHVAETIRLRIPQHLVDMGFSHLIECLYVKGYKRFIVQLPQSESSETILKLVEEAKGHPRVKSVNLGYNEIIVSLDGIEADSPLKFVRQYNIKIQELMEFMELVKTQPVNVEVIDRYVNETVNLAKIIERSLRKQGLTICEADSVDPSVAAPLVMIPQVLGTIYKELEKLDEIPIDIVRKLKTALQETFGGLSNRSSKRTITALKLADELRMEMENLAYTNTNLAKIAGLISGLTIMIKAVGEATICESVVSE